MPSQTLAPNRSFLPFYLEGHMAGAESTMWWKRARLASYVRSKEQQYARACPDLQCCPASSGEVSLGNLAKPENISVKGEGTINIPNVKRRL